MTLEEMEILHPPPAPQRQIIGFLGPAHETYFGPAHGTIVAMGPKLPREVPCHIIHPLGRLCNCTAPQIVNEGMLEACKSAVIHTLNALRKDGVPRHGLSTEDLDYLAWACAKMAAHWGRRALRPTGPPLMKIHLVIWSECDSGYEIKGAFFDLHKAQQEADRLNLAEAAALIASVEDHIKRHPESMQNVYRGDHGEWLSLEAAIASCRRNALKTAAECCMRHSVETVEVI
jgi:hypothetical protein